jgi:hypothetical protein
MKKVFIILFLLIFEISVLKSEEVTVLGDFESGASGWVGTSWKGSVNAQIVSNYYYQGSKSYRIRYSTTEAWGNAGVGYKFGSFSNISQYDVLRFYLRGEVTNTGRLNVAMYDDENNQYDQNYDADDYIFYTLGPIRHNFWVEYIIPIKASFFADGNADNGNNIIEFDRIEEIDFYFDDPYQGCSGTVYIDKVELVKGYKGVGSQNIFDNFSEGVEITDFNNLVNSDDKLTFKIVSKEQVNIDLKIIDFGGRVLYNKNYSNFSGEENFNWDLKIGGIKLKPGIYFVIMNYSNFSAKKENTIRKKFLIIK